MVISADLGSSSSYSNGVQNVLGLSRTNSFMFRKP